MVTLSKCRLPMFRDRQDLKIEGRRPIFQKSLRVVMNKSFEKDTWHAGFSVQLSSTNPFGRIPVDQCVETTINRDTQTQGGTKGFSLKPSALNRYNLIAEYRSAYLRIFRETLDLHEVELKHHDLQKTRMQRDEMDVSG